MYALAENVSVERRVEYGMSIPTAYIYVVAACVAMFVGLWKLLVKAGKPGWAAIVPFYNLYCMFDITFGKGWMFLLLFVPVVGLVFAVMLWFKLAKAFGKGIGFGFGLLFLSPIFICILGFGNAEYVVA